MYVIIGGTDSSLLSDGESDPDEDFSKLHSKSSSSYLNLTDSSYSLGGGGALVMSPLSSPDKDGELVNHL